jgi:hypothetical protein
MTPHTGNGITIRFVDHGFQLEFSCFESFDSLESQVTCVLPVFRKGALLILAVSEHTRPEVTSPIDSLTPIWYRWQLDSFYLSLTIQNSRVIRLLRFECKMPIKNLRDGILLLKIFFLEETPKRRISLSQSASFEPLCVKIDSVGPYKKKKGK